MGDNVVIVPCDADGFVELARTKTGRLFRKHLLSEGNLRHPVTGKDVPIDAAFLSTLKANFDASICDTVAVPLANDANQHTEDPARNVGEVIGVEVKDKKFYAVMDVRDSDHADKFGKTYLGASAMLHLDYTDTKSGSKVGPTLLHACVTNRPYVTGLESYEEIVAATSDRAEGAVLLVNADVAAKPSPIEETVIMTDAPTAPQATPAPASLEELLSTLKSQHNIDVAGLQAQAATGEQAATLSKTLVDALTAAGVVKLSAAETDTVSTETLVGAVAELASSNVALSNSVKTLERDRAEALVGDLITTGRVLPAQKSWFVELKLTNPTMFDGLVPAEPIVKLNNEQGVTPPQDQAHAKNVDDEIARLTASYIAPAATK